MTHNDVHRTSRYTSRYIMMFIGLVDTPVGYIMMFIGLVDTPVDT